MSNNITIERRVVQNPLLLKGRDRLARLDRYRGMLKGRGARIIRELKKIRAEIDR